MWAKLLETVLTKLAIKLVEYLAYILPDAASKWAKKKKKLQKQEEAKAEMEKVYSDKKKTKKDRAKSYEKYINS